MQINFEHLELIPKIYEKLQQIEMNLENNYSKRWLNKRSCRLHWLFKRFYPQNKS